jgi:hypothetical protein
MSLEKVAEFVRSKLLAVQASSSTLGQPQAAVIGVVTSDRLELFFDTLVTSRKCANLRRRPPPGPKSEGAASAVASWRLLQPADFGSNSARN